MLRQPIVIENRPGAGGNIAAEQAAHATADGYTLLMGNTGILAANPARKKDVGFDPQLDFAPITLVGTQANALVVNPALPAHTLAQSDRARQGEAGPHHLRVGRPRQRLPSRRRTVQGRGQGRTSSTSLTRSRGRRCRTSSRGHVQIMFAPAALVANHVRAGRLRALGVATAKPSPLLPGVATLDELGLPASTPPPGTGWSRRPARPRRSSIFCTIRQRPCSKTRRARKIMGGLGIDVVGNSPREFEAYIEAQIPKWSAVIKSIVAHTQ